MIPSQNNYGIIITNKKCSDSFERNKEKVHLIWYAGGYIKMVREAKKEDLKEILELCFIST
jgi:hypothetical protein